MTASSLLTEHIQSMTFEKGLASEPVSLAALNSMAALHTRVDRKYVVDTKLLELLLRAVAPQHRVLEIDGKQRFGYQSVYFDTLGLDLYHAAATGRRKRYKVRTRTYLDSQLCMFEVKTKGGRGETSKHRMPYRLDDRTRLSTEAASFVGSVVGAVPGPLVPVLTTSYERSTLVDPKSASRLTIDHNLVCSDQAGSGVALDAIVLETKSSNAPSPVDRWLWASGIRPDKISKFCTGLAALQPELRSNKWHRALQYSWRPAPARTVC